tara:strand:+ start:1510 stop:2799 length:1290 start_codon:yes stop_codon:yes gene_type:complete
MDNIVLYNILVGSVNKGLKQAKVTGKLNLYDVHVLSLFGKLLNDFSTTLTHTQKSCLEEAIRVLQNKNKYICNYKNISGITSNNIINVKPIISDLTIAIPGITHYFTYNNFTSNFTDVNNDLPDKIKIISLPTEGALTYNGSNVLVNNEFTSSQITSLLYTWTDYTDNSDSLTFQVNDNNNNNPLFSDMATMTLNITASVNLPPSQVGTLALSIDNSTTHIFTSANFTTETTPVYLDPEGDAAKNLKITTLSSEGILTLNNVSLNVNDIISFADITLGNLKYVSDSANQTAHTDTFNFSISDEGSDSFTSGGTVNVTIAVYVNQAPTVGDSSLTTDEGSIIIFTKNNFLIDANPDYNDTEGDIATSIRFPTLPSTGLIKLNNVNVTVNQEIALTDVDSSLLTYTQASNAGGSTPSFTFNIKDSYGNWSN